MLRVHDIEEPRFIMPDTPIADLKWVRSRRWPKSNTRGAQPLAIVDLFCGCGGLTLGAWEGARVTGRCLNIRYALDCAQEPLSVYRKNLRVSDNVAEYGDICSLLVGEIGSRTTSIERKWAKSLGPVDVLLAGPPCQGHSDLNNHSRRKDPRNALYLRVIRAIELVNPQVAIVENVPAVIHDKSNVAGRAVRRLSDLGYTVYSRKVDLSHYGVPQTRRRHLLLACQEYIDFEQLLSATKIKTGTTVGQFLSDIQDEPESKIGLFYCPGQMSEANRKRAQYLFGESAFDLPNELRPACHRATQHSYVSMYGRMYWDRPCQTITSGFGSMGQGRYLHPTRCRTLTCHEAARLQGFPDFFDFTSATSLTSLRTMIANAVPPQLVARLIAGLVRNGAL